MLAGTMGHLKIEKSGLSFTIDADVAGRQVPMHDPCCVQLTKRLGDCFEIRNNCGLGGLVEVAEGAGRALRNVATFYMVDRQEKTIGVLKQRTGPGGSNMVSKDVTEIVLMAQAIPHMPALVIGHAETTTFFEDYDAQLIRGAHVHGQGHRALSVNR